MTQKPLQLFLLVLLTALMACNKNARPGTADILPNTLVLRWNEVAYEAFGGPQYEHSLMAARINAMVHLAMHDALNAVKRKYGSYVFTGQDAEAHPVVAAAVAAHDVLVHELPAKTGFIDSVLAESLSGLPEGPARARGLQLGKAVAQAVLEQRANDGSGGEVIGQIPPSGQAGVYQPVPPFNILFAPHWENVRLFSLERKDQFRLAPHPSLTGAEFAAAFNEVKSYGRLNSTTRTEDQSAYASFWYEFSEAGWNRVARLVAASRNLDLYDAARLLALVDMAIADSYTAGWDAKTHYNFWRPYTSVRKADLDGNPATAADTSWEPFLPTPPVPDYPSTHSALGNAAATVLANILGDQTRFTMTSPTGLPGKATRTFTSFHQAANENADSRVMAGIHFRFSCVAGQELGNKIGAWTVEHHLKPVK